MSSYNNPFDSSDLTNHLGSNRVVATHTGQVEQRNMFYPYGASRADCWSDSAMVQRWKYSGKELDSFQGLHCYDYGFRWYDTIVCRWTTPDPMREKYYDISAYVYCMGNPLKLIDPDGRKVIAYGTAQENILYTLSKKEAEYVIFDKYGHLDISRLLKFKGSSDNFDALKALALSETNYIFSVSDKDLSGEAFYEKGNHVESPYNYYYGITHIPDAEFKPSPDENVYILTASFLSEELQVRNTAHEGYGHAYFYELSKNNPSVNPFHTKGVVTSILEYDPDLGISYYVPVFGNNNTLLEKRISMVENQAINNYENWKE